MHAPEADIESVKTSLSEWFDPAEHADVNISRALREQQQRYTHEAEALWRELKALLTQAVSAHNAHAGEPSPVTCAETGDGGFAVTRFTHPLALLDVAIDIESGMIACIYTLMNPASATCRERLNVLLIRGTESEWFLTDRNGQRLALQESAKEVIEPYVVHLRALSAR